MKYPGLDGNGTFTTTPNFAEQYETVVGLFDKWNDCERTVLLCALLKRIPYSNLKFLEFLINNNLAPAYNSQPKLRTLESNANNAAFLDKLINRYKIFSSAAKEATFLYDTSQKDKYESKEEILKDILMYMLLLRPGNEDAKTTYFNIIPNIVEDSIKQIVSTELVQQIFSYLLIHPATSNEDQKSLDHWLCHLQDCSPSNQEISKLKLFALKAEMELPSPVPAISAFTSWRAIAPPPSVNNSCNNGTCNTWDLHKLQVTQDICDGNNSSGRSSSINNNSSNTSKLEQSSDDHHLSFSKNGTEILDFDFDYLTTNTAIGFETYNDTFLTIPGCENSAIKSRRSNSLTTTPSHQNLTSSNENLAAMALIPRSYSMSVTEGIRGQLSSAGSDTRLDELRKPNCPRYSTYNIGMSNIVPWLKSLRLHKYLWLFTNLSYDQMMVITEEYLENLNVTKGARNKLVICIKKLKDRYNILQQMETDLTSGAKQIPQVLEELTNIVITPMKPVDIYSTDDVAGMFFRVLDFISERVTANYVRISQHEDTVNVILWILERALHNEAFVAQTNQLKEHKHKLSKLKSQFTAPKGNYNKNNNNNGAVKKMRWNNKNKSNSSDGLKPPRRNSMPIQDFPPLIQPGSQQSLSPMFYHATLNNNNNINDSHNSYNKSASYPNFVPAANSTIAGTTVSLADSVQRSLLAFGQIRPKLEPPQSVVNSSNCNDTAVAAAAVAHAQESLSSLVHQQSVNNFIF